MTDAPHARITERPGIITVTIDREAKRNAISPQVTATLWEAVRALAERDDLRCLVITAIGSYFTAGIDLGARTSDPKGEPAGENPHPGWNYRRNYRNHHLLYDEMETIEKPIILAAQSTVLGAGVEMAMSCDFRFCTPHTLWGLPEIDLGVVAGSGGSSRLTRLVGPHWAKWLAMAGQRVTAERALMMGLVHEVYPPDELMERVYAFCDHLISLPQEAVGMAKLAVDLAADVADRSAQRHIDRIVNTSLVGSPEHNRRTARFKK
ncbi:MAG: enoyl-CoA hydratase/isomerase family protein [Phenylobacterium sp.]|nr:enoyl-CoA hydratase/isomerase family protein [Phenylobacterium sp.]